MSDPEKILPKSKILFTVILVMTLIINFYLINNLQGLRASLYNISLGSMLILYLLYRIWLFFSMRDNSILRSKYISAGALIFFFLVPLIYCVLEKVMPADANIAQLKSWLWTIALPLAAILSTTIIVRYIKNKIRPTEPN